ncbi:MAG: alpha/beta hydrolase, partial [Acidobacteriota bacterium]|nr:alpha/beta hydrolase [Acidobacteriota bacterium]
KDLAWLVLLAPPATVGEETLLRQSEMIGRAGGLSDTQLESSLSFDHAAYDLVRTQTNSATLAEKLAQLVKDSQMDAALPPAALENQMRMLSSPWFRFFLDYDPTPALRILQTPTLALYGQKDLQVPAKPNLLLIQKSLQDARNKDFEVRELADLNHMFQPSYSGSPAEYQAIEETFSPVALQAISDWLLPRVNHK